VVYGSDAMHNDAFLAASATRVVIESSLGESSSDTSGSADAQKRTAVYGGVRWWAVVYGDVWWCAVVGGGVWRLCAVVCDNGVW
jgi:hypothetical protein